MHRKRNIFFLVCQLAQHKEFTQTSSKSVTDFFYVYIKREEKKRPDRSDRAVRIRNQALNVITDKD